MVYNEQIEKQVIGRLKVDNPWWTKGAVPDFLRKILLSAKLQNATISLSAMPINRRCGLLFGKVSPPFPTIIHWLSAKTREWKTRDVAKCVL